MYGDKHPTFKAISGLDVAVAVTKTKLPAGEKKFSQAMSRLQRKQRFVNKGEDDEENKYTYAPPKPIEMPYFITDIIQGFGDLFDIDIKPNMIGGQRKSRIVFGPSEDG